MPTRAPPIRRRLAPGRSLLALLGATLLGLPVAGVAAEQAADESFAIHGQATYVEQETNAFSAPYRGANSLSPATGRETFDATLYLGARLWPGAEGWLTPEADQGFGLDDTLGVAAFPSGEAYKVGRDRPYLRLPRAFVRQTLSLGDDRAPVEAGLFQLAGTQSADRVVVTVGKFSVGDVFDTNQYAHDPAYDFLNWAPSMPRPSTTPPTPGASRSAPPSSGTRAHGRCAAACSTSRTSRTASTSSPRPTSSRSSRNSSTGTTSAAGRAASS